MVLTGISAQSTDVESLKKQREQYERDISNAKKLLKTKGNTRIAYLNDLKLINAQISAQKLVIASYKKEMEAITEQININKELTASLEEEISFLRDGYKNLILSAHKQMGSNYNEFMLVFSAKSFSEAYRRFHLMKQYASYRKKQGLVLIDTKLRHDSIVRENEIILESKQKRYLALLNEIESLKRSVSQKQKYIADLKKDEKWLRREILKKESATKKLQASIEKLIRESSSEVGYSFSNFHSAKGKLNWPVENGIVTSSFGEHNHAVLKGVKIKNNGIDITASKENRVKCVYEGTVSRVIAIPGYNKAVIVRHGKYLTVYANLAKVDVKNDQVVKSNQSIGQIFADNEDKNGILHFEIWEESKKINPLEWLQK
ncbi:murein hydrolase activator EnvC family protein [Saccharicrinis fermentans]|uniref:murein hydrolase activator EnvC family protein n=1 Tax=Saccharicrinis fermentans TaxID=982 RepID=UPI0004AFFDC1|nr:peptidoglycan DD-metalloendopeptidase family protein [Saccharicrinis fermentans]